MEIFCDESGFTGNQMLDAQQHLFTYATVAIDSQTAQDCVEILRRKHRLLGTELKGADLVKQTRGRHAVTELLQILQGKFRFAVHLKPYALAGKLFEYIFEPAFSQCNSIFYEINFHRFISTLLFAFFRASDTDTSKLLQDFSTFARKGDTTALAAMFPSDREQTYTENPLHAIGVFAEIHRQKIADEVLGFREPGVPNWMLDLTTTSLYHLLASWGQTYESLEVTCDEAKPLKGDLPLFEAMVGRTEKATIIFQGKEHPILFNLSRPLILGTSHDIPGLQLADIVAAAAGVAWKPQYEGESTEWSSTWKELMIEGIAPDSIWPDFSNANLNYPEAFANSVVMLELVKRSLKQQDLCEGIYELYRWAVGMHPDFMKDSSLKRSTP